MKFHVAEEETSDKVCKLQVSLVFYFSVAVYRVSSGQTRSQAETKGLYDRISSPAVEALAD